MHPVKKTLFISALLGTFMLQACLEDPDCSPQGNNEAVISFFDKEDGSPLTLDIDSIWVNEFTGNLAVNQSLSSRILFLDPTFRELHLNIVAGDTSGVFTFNYNAVPKLYADNCDVVFLYTNFGIKYTNFDSLVLKPNVNPVAVEIYF